MVNESRRRSVAGGALRVGCLALACCGCAQVLGIPSDPQLVPPAARAPADAGAAGEGATGSEVAPIFSMPMSGSPGSAGTPDADSPGRDGVLPADGLGGISAPTYAPTDAGAAGIAADAGRVHAADASPSDVPCSAEPAPVDIVFAVDNSGSMAEEDAAFEQALPEFVARLSSAGVDYRIVLVSRHRRGGRGEDDSEADTSLCIAAPISGLAACPSDSPALGERFFHYSIKLDASDSFERLLESFDEPDPFGLSTAGWSEWLRPLARRIFVEITDADSDTSVADFTRALAAASPELFGAGAASFVFHSVIGITANPTGADAYAPGEPIVVDRCSGAGSSIDNAGPTYQELSRATGGLRSSICPPTALGQRLTTLAADTVARSTPACPR